MSKGGFFSDIDVGLQLADTIVTSIKKKFIAGPFSAPPLFNSRINQMFPIVQPDKVRMIVNMSYPPGFSFNDNLNYSALRKVTMSSAPIVGELIRKCQGKATLSKYDMVAAYKLVPCQIKDIKLQGFSFLGKYFYETRQIFGAASSVSFYDDLHLLLVLLTLKRMTRYCNELFLPRILDDLIGIFTSEKTLNEFHDIYTTLSAKLGISLAPFIGTKAYVHVDKGMALGIEFSSKNVTWSLPKQKQEKYINKIHDMLEDTWVSLKTIQELNGCLNYIVAMCPILRHFRHHLMADEHKARDSKDEKIILSTHTRFQLITWLKIINAATDLPIPVRHRIPPISVLCIISDAAGRSSNSLDKTHNIGAAAASYIDGNPNKLISVCQAFFPESLITYQKDDKNTRFGDKSTFLELCAILLGIIHNKEMLYKNQVLLLTDSLPALWALEKGRSSNCLYSSTICLAIATILQSLQCYYFLKHVKRKTTYAATVSDALTRDDKAGDIYSNIYKNKLTKGWPKQLQNWLEKPYLDDSLGARIFKEISGTFSWPLNYGREHLPLFLPLGKGRDKISGCLA